tara:strand:- start:18 stop:221 length:204 start_codon:yes stop_codon:yes gene_type:complete
MSYSEIMKRKDRVIDNCQDVKSVLNDLKSDILSVEDAKLMLYSAMQQARTDGYLDGWNKTKQIKKKR